MRSASSRNSESMALAKGKNIRCSPRKLNLLAEIIRHKRAQDALNILSFSKKRVAGVVKKVLNSAIANAENNHGLDIDKLVVQEAFVGKGLVMKRFHARARGRGAPIQKPFSHITIIVKEEKTSGKKES